MGRFEWGEGDSDPTWCRSIGESVREIWWSDERTHTEGEKVASLVVTEMRNRGEEGMNSGGRELKLQ